MGETARLDTLEAQAATAWAQAAEEWRTAAEMWDRQASAAWDAEDRASVAHERLKALGQGIPPQVECAARTAWMRKAVWSESYDPEDAKELWAEVCPAE